MDSSARIPHLFCNERNTIYSIFEAPEKFSGVVSLSLVRTDGKLVTEKFEISQLCCSDSSKGMIMALAGRDMIEELENEKDDQKKAIIGKNFLAILIRKKIYRSLPKS